MIFGRRKRFCEGAVFLLVWFLGMVVLPGPIPAQIKESVSPPEEPRTLTLVQAVMCEEVQGQTPQNEAIAFSLKVGKVICFTAFDPVPEKTFIYHKWFFRDALHRDVRLTLKPPRWASVSSMQLREADKGPWRVEIRDEKGRLLQILRFSIVD
jgi:hypothetical protein